MTRGLPVKLPEGYVEFYKQLENWQNEEFFRLKRSFELEKVDLLRLIMKHKRPLLEQVQMEIDLTFFRDSYQRLLVFLLEIRPEVAPELKSIIENFGSLDIKQLVTAHGEIDIDYSQKTSALFGWRLDLFLFTADLALHPFLQVFAMPYRNELLDERFFWEFPNICPICGAKSYISRLTTEDGQRFMFCGHCFSEWKVRFLACVHCGHDIPEDINFIKIDEDPYYRIYVCEKCKGYLKTYDQKNAGVPVDLFIANQETVYLDILARDRGYTTHDE